MKHGTWTQREDGVIELREEKSSGGGGTPITPKEAVTFLVVLALIVVLIIGFVHCYKAAHSPKTINISLTNVRTEFVPSKYSSNGTRYLYLDFEVESKRHKVDEINLYLNINDTAGNNLGRLSVSLGSNYDRLELPKRNKRSITISWNDDYLYWGDEDIFNILYSTDYSDLTFTYEIHRVVYSNDYVWFQSSNNNQPDNNTIDKDEGNNASDNDIISSNDSSENSSDANGNNALLVAVKDYTSGDAILPDGYSSVIYHTSDCGWYSYADEEYYNSYYIIFTIDEESTSTFIENFISKLISDGYTLRCDENGYEYVKNNTVICFSPILESQVDGQFEYYYIQYYAFSLN